MPYPSHVVGLQRVVWCCLEIYRRVFGTTEAFPSVRFNFQHDVLYIHEKDLRRRPRDNLTIELAWDDFSAEDLARVENLALHAMRMRNYEIWVVEALEKLGNVNNLTLVQRHYRTPYRYRNEQEELGCPRKGDLAFVDPLNINTALERYERPEDRDCIQEEDLHSFSKPFLGIKHIDMDLLEGYRESWNELGFGDWKMPSIHEKMIMTSYMKGKMDELRRNWIDVKGMKPRYFFRDIPKRRQRVIPRDS